MSNTIPSNSVRDMAQIPRPSKQDATTERADGNSLPAGGESLPTSAPQRVAETAISDAVKQLNDYVQTMSRELHISVDKESGRTVIRVIDPESKELIRQIPQEEILALARNSTEESDRGRLLRVLA